MPAAVTALVAASRARVMLEKDFMVVDRIC